MQAAGGAMLDERQWQWEVWMVAGDSHARPNATDGRQSWEVWRKWEREKEEEKQQQAGQFMQVWEPGGRFQQAPTSNRGEESAAKHALSARLDVLRSGRWALEGRVEGALPSLLRL